mgnify:CR=1 FL=1
MIVTPLILPILIWGAIAIAGGLTVAGISGVFDDPKKNKLGLLGMQISGKTRFLSYLRNIKFVEHRSGRNKYEEFIHTLNNGKKITICSGVDIAGGEQYRVDYDKIIKESDVVLYFFDIDKYLRNEIDLETKILYQRSCNSRFEHIYSRIKSSQKSILVIATHTDKCNLSENAMKQQFDCLISNKSYKEMLKGIEYVNLTNPSEIKSLVNKIFKGK